MLEIAEIGEGLLLFRRRRVRCFRGKGSGSSPLSVSEFQRFSRVNISHVVGLSTGTETSEPTSAIMVGLGGALVMVGMYKKRIVVANR